MDGSGTPRELRLRFPAELWLFLAARNRELELRVPYDGTSSPGHVVESLGVPLTEVGAIVVHGDLVEVRAIGRPQRLPDGQARFLLDVHLGALARRLRLVGIDTAYRNDLDDDQLIEQATAERRVLLTKDRGLLSRRALRAGAYVRGDRADEQLHDVLDRFAPPLAPWTRCSACNGALVPVGKREVEHLLLPGTRRTQEVFARCEACGHVYWPGAHHGRLTEIVAAAAQAKA